MPEIRVVTTHVRALRGGTAEATAVKAGWKANAPGAAEEEAEKKSILYPKGRTREIAEMEKMFDDKLGPHVR